MSIRSSLFTPNLAGQTASMGLQPAYLKNQALLENKPKSRSNNFESASIFQPSGQHFPSYGAYDNR